MYSFPASGGSSGQVLSTNADGTTRWIFASGIRTETVVTISADTTATINAYHLFVSGASLLLPAAPQTGVYVGVINRSNITTGLLYANGSNIMGVADDLQIDDLNARFRLIYAGSSQGWVID